MPPGTDLGDEFMQLIDENVLEEFAQERFPVEMHEDVELSASVQRWELDFLASGVTSAYNQSIMDGELVMASLHWHGLQVLLDMDEQLREEFEEAQNTPGPVDIFGGAMGGGWEDDYQF